MRQNENKWHNKQAQIYWALLFTRTCAVTIFIFDLRNKGCRCLVGNTKKCFRLERSFFFASIPQMFFQGISWLMIRKWHTRMQNSRTCFFSRGGSHVTSRLLNTYAFWQRPNVTFKCFILSTIYTRENVSSTRERELKFTELIVC